MTEITSELLPSTLVSFAVADPRTPTTSDLPKAGHSGERSAMSTPFPCVEDTIARCTVAAMKPRGGAKPRLIRPLLPARYGSKHTRCRQIPLTRLLIRQSL